MLLSEAISLNTSARWRATLLITGLTLTVIGFVSWMVSPRDFAAGRGDGISLLPSVTGYLAASLFIAATGMVSAALVAHGRLHASSLVEPAAEGEEAETAGKLDARRWIPPGLDVWKPEVLAGWPQVLVSILMGALALAAVFNCWSLGNQPAPSSLQAEQVYGGVLVLLAFPFLVLERIYANTPPRALPDAPQLERLSRVPLACFVGLGITRVLLSIGFEWATMIERAIAVVIGLVSLELVLRGLAMIFVPFAPISSRRSTADSTVAGLLRLTMPTLTSVGTTVKRQFGIDLSRSWALAFVRRAAPPIGLGLALFAWCLTGVTALGINERAVYERLGMPISVFGPGIHVHLPWPFGIVRGVELGVLHDVPVVLAPEGGQSDFTHASQMAGEAGIEGLAPVSADRLWDETHPSEASYLIASEARGRQSFQIVNVDLRIVYRIGLSDAAARNAVYSVADPEALTRALAGRLLARYFAHYTLLDVLGQSRERFANDFRDALQDQLRELATGIDVIAVVVEAIHPPAGAAAAYHNVQAAEILARSQIALRRADAITAIKFAEQNATTIRASAAAAAAERVNQARAADAMFEGDRQAWLHDGEVFLFERWLDRLGGGLARSSFILLDHRLKGATAPTVDLRSLAPPGMPGPVDPAQSTPPDHEPGAGPNQTSRPAPEADPDER
jgi:regulator of protease activity HflC (stomatin/prohibitin superfamily)